MTKHQGKSIRSEIENIRVNLSDRFLLTAALFGPITLVVSIARAATFAWDYMVFVNGALVLCLCILAWKRAQIHHQAKSVAIVAILLTAGVSGAIQYGLLSTSLFYLLLAPYFAAVLFGKRGATITLLFSIVAMMGVGGYSVSKGSLPPWDVGRYMTSPVAWTLEISVLLLSNAFLLITVNASARALVQSLTAKYRHEKHLVARSNLLEQSAEELRRANDLAQTSLKENAAMVARLDLVIRQTIDAFTTATVHTDPYTAGHEKRVADLALVIGRKLGLNSDQLLGLELAARAHDIGQLKVPSEILLRPHSLTALEFKFIQLHVEAGWEILKSIDFPWPVAEIVRQHHENHDGTGYPRGMRGDAILVEARIIRVADMAEALSSHRPFRSANTRGEVMKKITEASGTMLDPKVAALCLEAFAEGYSFPMPNASNKPLSATTQLPAQS